MHRVHTRGIEKSLWCLVAMEAMNVQEPTHGTKRLAALDPVLPAAGESSGKKPRRVATTSDEENCTNSSNNMDVSVTTTAMPTGRLDCLFYQAFHWKLH